jgi:hypothetical protein
MTPAANGKWDEIIERGRTRLSDNQLPDGRVIPSREHG